MNAIHYGRKTHLRTDMAAYSDNVYESVPFTCSARLSDEDLQRRVSGAIYKRFKPSHYAGCGYSCTVQEVVRETPTTGHIVIMQYQGIGD